MVTHFPSPNPHPSDLSYDGLTGAKFKKKSTEHFTRKTMRVENTRPSPHPPLAISLYILATMTDRHTVSVTVSSITPSTDYSTERGRSSPTVIGRATSLYLPEIW